jgi:hypothetical protein
VSISVVKWSEGLNNGVSIIIRRCIDRMKFPAYMAVPFITFLQHSSRLILYHFIYRCMFCVLLFGFVNYVFYFLCDVLLLLCLFILFVMYVSFCVFCFIVLFCVPFVCQHNSS